MREFVLDIWQLEDPIICIWTTDNPPDDEQLTDIPDHMAIDAVNFLTKEHIHSLFFPMGFVKGEWNLVIAGIKESPDVIQPPMHGILKGWMMGTDIQKLTLEVDI